MTDIPSDLFFTESHEWVRKNDDGTVTIGISDYAQDKLGDVVYWDAPGEGDELEKGDTLGVVESVKAVSDVYAPIGGEVVRSNDGLEDAPEQVNEDPFGEGWMVVLAPSDPSEIDGLMDAETYEAFVAEID